MAILLTLNIKLHTNCVFSMSVLCTTNGMMYYQGRHPLLMKYFIASLRCIRKMGEAYYSIYLPPLGHTMLFPPEVDSQIAHKMQDSGTLSTRHMGYCRYCKDIHPLLLECSVAFLRSIWNIGRASDSISELLVGHTMPFLLTLNIKLHTKCRFMWALSAWQLG